MRAVKTYDNTQSRAGYKKDSYEAMDGSTEGCNQEGTSAHSGQISVWGLWRRMTMPGLCWGNLKSLHIVDRLRFEGCEDRRHAESPTRQERESWYMIDNYANGSPQDNSSTKWTLFGLKAMKMDDSIESRAGVKMSPKCMTQGYTDRHHWDK